MQPCCLKRNNFINSTYEAWQEIIETSGYETISDMIYCLYVEENWGISKFSKELGFALDKKKLKILGLKIKGKGGANFTKNKKGVFTVLCKDGNYRRFKSAKSHNNFYLDIKCTHCNKIIRNGWTSNRECRRLIKEHNCFGYQGFTKDVECIVEDENIEELTSIANKMNFETFSDMLYCLYVEEHISPECIKKKIGQNINIEKYIRKLGIVLRHDRINTQKNNSGRFSIRCFDGKIRKFKSITINEQIQGYKNVYCIKCKTKLLDAKKWHFRKELMTIFRKHTC